MNASNVHILNQNVPNPPPRVKHPFLSQMRATSRTTANQRFFPAGLG